MSGFSMIEKFEIYSFNDDPIEEKQKDDSNHERKSKSLFSRILLNENYGKGVAIFSSYKDKLCSSVKKLGDDVSIASKKAVKKLEEAKNNLHLSEMISPLLNKISGDKNSEKDEKENQGKEEKVNFFDNYERLVKSDSEEKKQPPKIDTKKTQKSKKTKLNVNISDIKEASFETQSLSLYTEKLISILHDNSGLQVNEEEEMKNPSIESNHNIEINQKIEKEENKMKIKEKQKNEKKDKGGTSFHASLVRDFNDISTSESETQKVKFRSSVCTPSKPNLHHYYSQELPFPSPKQKIRVEIANEKKDGRKQKTKSKFLAWCCS